MNRSEKQQYFYDSDDEVIPQEEFDRLLKEAEEAEEETKRLRTILNNSQNFTPLINAIIKRDIDTVRKLLEEGADPNEPDKLYNWCPLKWVDSPVDSVLSEPYPEPHSGTPVKYYSKDIHGPLRELLKNKGAKDCYNMEEGDKGPYQFSELYNDTKGGRSTRVQSKKNRKTRKSRKSRKTRKTRKTTKKRKHMKK